MKALTNILCAAALGGALLFSAGSARADGIVVAPSALAPDARKSLEQQIQTARAQNPAAFEAIKNLKGHRFEYYKNNRNPFPTVARELRALGPAGLMPMLEALAVQQPERGSLTNEEWDALALGMLDAVGMIRDPRARPVVLAAFETGGLRPKVVAAAGRALGRLGGDQELAMLVKHAKDGDALAPYAVAGLGWMRRVESAKHLAALLASTKDATLAATAAEALGTVGSSWAWRALGEARRRRPRGSKDLRRSVGAELRPSEGRRPHPRGGVPAHDRAPRHGGSAALRAAGEGRRGQGRGSPHRPHPRAAAKATLTRARPRSRPSRHRRGRAPSYSPPGFYPSWAVELATTACAGALFVSVAVLPTLRET